MVDKYSKEVRSKIMSSIRSAHTKPELLLRKALFKKDYRYRVNHRLKGLNLKPDIVLVSKKTLFSK